MDLPDKVKLSDREFSAISRVVYDHCGINLKEDKRELVQSRLAKLVRQHKFSSYSDYLDQVLKDPSSTGFTNFIDHISTNLTGFFRENQHFEYLQEVLLPRIIQTVPASDPVRIRGWSAGCSSGEEPYSLAITLAEALQDVRRPNVKILASDISSRVIAAAREGYYSESQLAGIDTSIRRRYFDARMETSGRHYLVKKHLKEMILFKQINLMASWPITTPLDFIFCRNVMIYFDKPTQQRLISRFHGLLRPGGVLFIGHSESLSGIQHPFRYIAPTVYQKK